MRRQQIVEGSDVRVNCVGCGDSQWIVTVIEGKQKVTCSQCRSTTVVEFDTTSRGAFLMNTWRA